MSQRSLTASLLTAALFAGLTGATLSPAAAQGDWVSGVGNVYFLSGAYNPDGQAQAVFAFGDPEDEVYFGDWYGEGIDLPMVRRGNIFYVPSADDSSDTASVFAYGDEGDHVYIGDWDGDGVDSIAIRRGNEYFVKNDNRRTGIADRVFTYGDPDDIVLVGNWDGKTTAPVAGKDANGDGDFTDPVDPAAKTAADVAPVAGKGDTLTVVRGNEFFVKNAVATGIADYTFFFGEPDDAPWSATGRRSPTTRTARRPSPAATAPTSSPSSGATSSTCPRSSPTPPAARPVWPRSGCSPTATSTTPSSSPHSRPPWTATARSPTTRRP